MSFICKKNAKNLGF